MDKSRRGGGGADQQVMLLEKGRPLLLQRGPQVVDLRPLAVAAGVATEMAGDITLVVRRIALGAITGGGIHRIVVVGAGGSAHQVHVDTVALRAVHRPRVLADLHALLAQKVNQPTQRLLHAGIHLGQWIVIEHRHAAALRWRAAVLPGQRHAAHGGVQAQRRGQDVHRQRQVEGAARQRADCGDVEAVGAALGCKFMTGLWQHAPSRLVAPDTAVMRRIADRRADVAAELQRGEAGGQRRRRAARRAARRARGVPGVAGAAVNRVEALPIGQRDRHIGLAKDHRAGGLQPLHRHRVTAGDVVLEGLEAVSGGQAVDVERLLHRHRQAMQRAPQLATGQRRVGGLRAHMGALEIAHHHGIDVAAQPLDARPVVRQQRHRAQLPTADAAGQFMGGQKSQIGHAASP